MSSKDFKKDLKWMDELVSKQNVEDVVKKNFDSINKKNEKLIDNLTKKLLKKERDFARKGKDFESKLLKNKLELKKLVKNSVEEINKHYSKQKDQNQLIITELKTQITKKGTEFLEKGVSLSSKIKRLDEGYKNKLSHAEKGLNNFTKKGFEKIKLELLNEQKKNKEKLVSLRLLINRKEAEFLEKNKNFDNSLLKNHKSLRLDLQKAKKDLDVLVKKDLISLTSGLELNKKQGKEWLTNFQNQIIETETELSEKNEELNNKIFSTERKLDEVVDTGFQKLEKMFSNSKVKNFEERIEIIHKNYFKKIENGEKVLKNEFNNEIKNSLKIFKTQTEENLRKVKEKLILLDDKTNKFVLKYNENAKIKVNELNNLYDSKNDSLKSQTQLLEEKIKNYEIIIENKLNEELGLLEKTMSKHLLEGNELISEVKSSGVKSLESLENKLIKGEDFFKNIITQKASEVEDFDKRITQNFEQKIDSKLKNFNQLSEELEVEVEKAKTIVNRRLIDSHDKLTNFTNEFTKNQENLVSDIKNHTQNFTEQISLEFDEVKKEHNQAKEIASNALKRSELSDQFLVEEMKRNHREQKGFQKELVNLTESQSQNFESSLKEQKAHLTEMFDELIKLKKEVKEELGARATKAELNQVINWINPNTKNEPKFL